MSATDLKPVHVREYVRFRLGKLETVCEHYRSMPKASSN
jgi:hypothetical protein